MNKVPESGNYTDDLLLYRVLAAAGFVFLPLFWFVYKKTDPGSFDPFYGRLILSSYGLLIFIGSFFFLQARKHMQQQMYLLYFGAIYWFMYLLYKNHFAVNYTIGTFIVVYAISLGFKKRSHLFLFFSGMILCLLLISMVTESYGVNKFFFFITLISIFIISYFTTDSKIKSQEIIRRQNAELSEKNKDIVDSIRYARKIQEAILPEITHIKKALPHVFILYKPKDIVSGDFYWFAEKNKKRFIAAIDCTGHGVPGAFMSMIGNDQLNQIILEKNKVNPADILKELNKNIKTSLKQGDLKNSSRDGMDISLCVIDLENQYWEYAGANRPAYLIREKKLEIIRPDKTSIGGHTEEETDFSLHRTELRKNDLIYLFTDGYTDQFGGPAHKKFKSSQFRELLLSICHYDLHDQKKMLNDAIEKWKGNEAQTDDMLVIGIKF